MNDLQLFIAAGLPTVTVLVGILLNQRSVIGLEHRMDGMDQRMEVRLGRIEGRLDRIEADLRGFYRTLGQHDARLDNLEKRGA
ncbi:MAG: hypothetical protein ACRD3N_14555 [Terracidiphilus sp.]